MSKRNLYYLVARNRKMNDFQIIPVNGKVGNSLEEIDLYTTSYGSALELIHSLQEQGILQGKDIDFFIVSQKHKKGEKQLLFLDLLYKDSAKIREVAEASSQGKLDGSLKCVNDILNHFCWKMKYQPVFYNMVTYGDTQLYPKFVRYFVNQRYGDFYGVKYRDGAWVTKSYPLLRNIMDSFHQYDYAFGRSNHFSLDYVYRDLLEESLLEATTDGYNQKQGNIFEIEEASLTNEEKMNQTIEIFKELPTGVFCQEEDHVVFNQELFGNYDEGDLELLSSLLGSRLSFYVQLLTFHNYYYQKGLTEVRDVSEQEQAIEEDLNHISSLLESPDVLEKAFRWSLLYQKYKSRIVGDYSGYQYRKKSS